MDKVFNPTPAYFGLPNRRTCALIYFSIKNRTCAGLLGTVCLFILASKKFDKKNRSLNLLFHTDRLALIGNFEKKNIHFWEISTISAY